MTSFTKEHSDDSSDTSIMIEPEPTIVCELFQIAGHDILLVVVGAIVLCEGALVGPIFGPLVG